MAVDKNVPKLFLHIFKKIYISTCYIENRICIIAKIIPIISVRDFLKKAYVSSYYIENRNCIIAKIIPITAAISKILNQI